MENIFSGGLLNHLVLVSIRNISYKNSKIYSLQSVAMSKESINDPYASNIDFVSQLIDDYQFKKVKFKEISLRQDRVSFLHKSVVNLYIS